MTDERRYADDEIAEIFETAAAPDPGGRTGSPAGGLTLAELQSIGRDVGVSPERISEAAAAIDLRHNVLPRQTEFGMPISVGRTEELPRALTDREWDLLVSELRRTFHAQGRDGSRGELRSWTNGNLHAYVEPTEGGFRFRIGTLKGDATALNRLGIGGMLAGVILFGATAVSGAPLDVAGPLVLGGGGAAVFAYNALRLPRWASLRERQMDTIAARVRALTAEPERGVTKI